MPSPPPNLKPNSPVWRPKSMTADPQAKALLDALNELFEFPWQLEHGGQFVAYKLTLPAPGRERPFVYHRTIDPKKIESQPFRQALRWKEEVCYRYGEYTLFRSDVAR